MYIVNILHCSFSCWWYTLYLLECLMYIYLYYRDIPCNTIKMSILFIATFGILLYMVLDAPFYVNITPIWISSDTVYFNCFLTGHSLEYWIEPVTFGLLYVVFTFPTRIFYRGVPGFATDCPCGVWCRGLATCLLYVGLLLGNPV